MQRTRARTTQLTWWGLAIMGLGLATLLVSSWVEYLNNPRITLVDGYWIGRIPWVPAGVVLAVAGASSTLLAGAVAIAAGGDWVRRALAVPVIGAPVLWWLLAVGLIPFPGYAGPDPVTFAYSLPVQAAILLVVPALGIGALVTLPMGVDLRIRWRPVHPRDR